MNFFEHQDKAKSNTFKLLLLFILSVAAVIAAVYAIVMILFVYSGEAGPPPETISVTDLWNIEVFVGVALGLLLIMGTATLYKISQLSKGGGFIAESLGGRLILRSTKDFNEKKFLNVVEEMAIASGTPTPSVYVLDEEEGINAFAAGFSSSDAAVAATRGCIDQLNRDELQGVIAHEFSHIFNGDMRLNVRLIGFLSGIMALGVIGYFIIRATLYGRNRKGSQLALLGLALVILGYGGFFMGRIIQSAVSRQREYLADASAVQFTRNPNGISGALKKIGGYLSGSRVTSPVAQETSHMFFGNAVSSLFGSIFSTHPPLKERIKRIDAGFDVDLGETMETAGAAAPAAAVAGAQAAGFTGGATRKASEFRAKASELVDRVGVVSLENVDHGSALIAAIPGDIRNELGSPMGAALIVCGLLLDEDREARRRQVELLGEAAPKPFVQEMRKVGRALRFIDPSLRLPLVDLALPALRQLSPAQFNALIKYIDILARADGKITLFEFSLEKVIEFRLRAVFEKPSGNIKYNRISEIREDVVRLLSALAHAADENDEKARKTFLSALDRLPGSAAGAKLSPRDENIFESMGPVLDKLSLSSLGVKRAVFDACAHCVLYDGVVNIDEAELLRVIAYCMELPLPPFLPSTNA